MYRGINDFKKDYQLRTNGVKDAEGDLFTNYHSISARCRIHLSQLFNVHVVSNVRQTEIRTAEPLVNEFSAFEFGMLIENIKRHKSQITVPMPAGLIKAGGATIRSEIRKFINCIWDKEEMPE